MLVVKRTHDLDLGQKKTASGVVIPDAVMVVRLVYTRDETRTRKAIRRGILSPLRTCRLRDEAIGEAQRIDDVESVAGLIESKRQHVRDDTLAPNGSMYVWPLPGYEAMCSNSASIRLSL
jgi:hypothetical protein